MALIFSSMSFKLDSFRRHQNDLLIMNYISGNDLHRLSADRLQDTGVHNKIIQQDEP